MDLDFCEPRLPPLEVDLVRVRAMVRVRVRVRVTVTVRVRVRVRVRMRVRVRPLEVDPCSQVSDTSRKPSFSYLARVRVRVMGSGFWG